MFITVVIKAEYTPYSYRTNFYLKSLLSCKENGWIMIANEYIKNHFQELQNAVTDRFFREFEMRKFSLEELSDVEQYFIPDKIFDEKDAKYSVRTDVLFDLDKNPFSELEDYLCKIIETIKTKHPDEKIEGMFYCAETCAPFRRVCKKYGIPLIPYSFSAIKMPHGYRQTLYYASLIGQLYNSDECEIRYNRFLSENNNSIPVFSNREIIAFIGKERTLPLIQLMHHQPQYEMGVCCECYTVIPAFFAHNPCTDDDIFYECNELFGPDQIKVRSHALQLDHIQVDRNEVHNDPAAYILSCKRLSSCRSQIMLKVMMWGRTAIMKRNTHAFSFMCEHDYKSLKKTDVEVLNYYIFCYLVPNDLMFSGEYWQWRMTNPTETEIYKRHLDFYIEMLNLPKSILTEQDEPTRFKSLLQSRGCDEELINILLEDKHDFDIDYNTASSRIVINGKSYWRLNKIENGVRHFHIELNESADNIDFYPLDDVAGCARLVNVSVNGKPVDVLNLTDFRYMPKVSGHYSLPFPPTAGKTIIDIAWDYQSNNDFLQAHS